MADYAEEELDRRSFLEWHDWTKPNYLHPPYILYATWTFSSFRIIYNFDISKISASMISYMQPGSFSSFWIWHFLIYPKQPSASERTCSERYFSTASMIWQLFSIPIRLDFKNPWKWKWSNEVEKSDMSVIWCISITNNVKSYKKLSEIAQTTKSTVFTIWGRELPAEFDEN